MPYDGFLDSNDGWTAFGWAFDRERPDEPVDVEFFLDATPVGAVKADAFRPDLQQHGIGNGKHGFAFRFPLVVNGTDMLTARIKGTHFVLKGCPMPRSRRQSIEMVAGDIVNQCNLRCPFCMVDYTNTGRLKLMARETFARTVELLPLMTFPGNFWLSCLHEPTLHPRFIDFVEMVPDAYRDRLSFTTNLSKRLSPDLLERLANSGIHEIRISFDSRQPEVFAQLRKKAKYAMFEQNLLRLTDALRASRRRPQLRFITMAFKDNWHEIPDLVRFGRELGGNSHEVRYVYYVAHLVHWGKQHILDEAEWAGLERRLEPLSSPSLTITGPNETTRQDFEEEFALVDYVAPKNAIGGDEDSVALSVPDPTKLGPNLPDAALRLLLRWDGVIVPENWDRYLHPRTAAETSRNLFRVDINQLDRPGEYFECLRVAARRGRELLRA